MIEILGKEIPNQLNELTIQQFEDITEIHNDSSLDIIEKHIKVFELLGVSEDEMVIESRTLRQSAYQTQSKVI